MDKSEGHRNGCYRGVRTKSENWPGGVHVIIYILSRHSCGAQKNGKVTKGQGGTGRRDGEKRWEKREGKARTPTDIGTWSIAFYQPETVGFEF